MCQEIPTKRKHLEDVASTCCNLSFSCRRQYRGHLRSQLHVSNNAQVLEEGIYKTASSFKNRIATYRITDSGKADISTFLESVKLKTCKLIHDTISQLNSLKLQLELFAYYTKFINDEELIQLKSFNTKYVVVTVSTVLENVYDQLADIIKNKSDEFQEKDSGFAFSKVSHLEINLNSFKPIEGSSYIKLPPNIEARKACINIKCNDNKCFAWSLMAAVPLI
ncbi:hypothetical protein QE152_g16903 [Popillia japonica]|uniref:C2H2-type domain-containing protein n=1 Tax=Popillia japonica TaxID=7064 RepID=A0AAW1L386_POPJA